jgi:hypothetical protein
MVGIDVNDIAVADDNVVAAQVVSDDDLIYIYISKKNASYPWYACHAYYVHYVLYT